MDSIIVLLAIGSPLISIIVLSYFAGLLKDLKARLDVLIRLQEWELETKYGEAFRPRKVRK